MEKTKTQRNLKGKGMLTGLFLFLFLLFSTGGFAQEQAISLTNNTPTTFVDGTAAIQSLASSIQDHRQVITSAAAASDEYIDAERRIKVYAYLINQIKEGNTVKDSYKAAVRMLFHGIDAKKTEHDALKLIRSDIADMLMI